MAEKLGEAVLGAVVSELLKAVIEIAKKEIIFKSEFRELQTTLQLLHPAVEKLQELNKDMDLPIRATEELTKKIKEGTKLVHKCSRIRWWHYFRKSYYASKIIKLNECIGRLSLPLQVESFGDTKEILQSVRGSRGVSCSAPNPPPLTLGFDVPLKELKNKLFEDGVERIVVSAPGGSGKTTLVKTLCHDEEVKARFGENIFFVTVSQTPNVMDMVQKLSNHIGRRSAEYRTDEEAINNLGTLLRKKEKNDILLVLDDVWSGSESLLRSFKFQLPNIKIIVTSRSEFRDFGFGYQLKPLDDQAAQALFRHSAIPGNESSYVPYDYESLINKIVRTCRGSPLALTVVGGSLYGEPPAVWRAKAKKWANGASFVHSEEAIRTCLESSLDALPNDLMECYMDLSSFPEDQRIPFNSLVDMWIELYEPFELYGPFDDDVAISKLYELSKRNLVEHFAIRKNTNDDDHSFNDHFVMHHDLLRELITHRSKMGPIEQRKRQIVSIKENSFPTWWSEQKQHPVNAHLLSISTDEMFQSGWEDIEGPKVEVVVLNLHSRKYTLPYFMEKMSQLKVLIVTNYGFYPAELTNFPLVSSLSNLKRIRLERISIPLSDMSGFQVRNLKKLSFVMCNIGELFRSSTFQISDAFPNLLEIDIDYCSDLVKLPDGICDIVSLKKLGITNCHKLSELPEEINKLTNLENLRLTSCTDLSSLPESMGKLPNLKFLDISDCISIGELPSVQVGELRNLETIRMSGCSACEIPRSVIYFKNLQVVKCDEETACQWENFKQDMGNLKIEVLKEDINLDWLNGRDF